jgi:hypothetical protein
MTKSSLNEYEVDPSDIARLSLPIANSQIENLMQSVHNNLREKRVKKRTIPETS